jgi:regulator of protease activity HflC (stomatin/prohibitin superfamily)
MSQIKLFVGAIVAVVLVATLIAMWPLVTVPAGHRGVITLFGDVESRVLEPGLGLVNPLTHVHDMNVQVQKAVIKGDAASKDLQHVSTTLNVNFALDPKKVAELYSNVGTDYEAKLLDGTAQDAFKGVTAQYTAEELITKRETVRALIRDALTAKVSHLSAGAVLIDDVFITNFDFSPEFNAAIEAKQEASQKAQKATQDLARIKIEAEQRIAQSQAEAQAIKIQAEAIQQSGGLAYVQLQAINKWNGQLPYYTGGSIPFIQLATANQPPMK